MGYQGTTLEGQDASDHGWTCKNTMCNPPACIRPQFATPNFKGYRVLCSCFRFTVSPQLGMMLVDLAQESARKFKPAAWVVHSSVGVASW